MEICYIKINTIDGITPFFFIIEKKVKVLHLNLWGLDKIFNILNIKNEKSNTHRILSGVLDINNFYMKNCNTSMCSFVNNWSINNIIYHNIKYLLEFIFMKLLFIITVITRQI